MQACSTCGAGPYKQFWMRGVTYVVFSSVSDVCFKCFIYLGVSNVAMTIYVCCKRMF
jgi:hypothetical protein